MRLRALWRFVVISFVLPLLYGFVGGAWDTLDDPTLNGRGIVVVGALFIGGVLLIVWTCGRALSWLGWDDE